MSALQPFSSLNTRSLELNRVQDRIQTFANQLVTCPFILGSWLTVSTTTPTGAGTAYHQLGAQPLGWFITDRTDTFIVRRVSWDADTIVFQAVDDAGAAVAVTFDVWVF